MSEKSTHTPPRQIRIGDDWNDFDLAANSQRTDRAQLIRDYIAWYLHRPNAPKKLTRPDPHTWQSADATAGTDGNLIDRLSARIRTKGGQWDGKRALAAYEELGFYCTIQRARTNLKKAAEANPDLLTAVEGKRWTYDTTAQPNTTKEPNP